MPFADPLDAWYEPRATVLLAANTLVAKDQTMWNITKDYNPTEPRINWNRCKTR